MSRHWLRCLECEERFSFPNVFCTYWTGPSDMSPEPFGNRWIPILQIEVWCASCNSPSYAERVPSVREFEDAAGLRRVAAAGGTFDVRDTLLDLSEAEFLKLFEGLRDRRSPGVCVVCGGRSYVPLLSSNGRIRNLKHEDCGGTFAAYWQINNDHGNRVWLDFAGNLIFPPNDQSQC
jgi:hypothetical protein